MGLTFSRPVRKTRPDPKEIKPRIPFAKIGQYGSLAAKQYDAKIARDASEKFGTEYFTGTDDLQYKKYIPSYEEVEGVIPDFTRAASERYKLSPQYLDYIEKEGITEEMLNLPREQKDMILRDLDKNNISVEGVKLDREGLFKKLNPEEYADLTSANKAGQFEVGQFQEDINLLEGVSEDAMNLVDSKLPEKLDTFYKPHKTIKDIVKPGGNKIIRDTTDWVNPQYFEQIIDTSGGLDALIQPPGNLDTPQQELLSPFRRKPAFQNIRDKRAADMFNMHKTMPSTSPNIGIRTPQDMIYRPDMPAFDPSRLPSPTEGILENIWKPERFGATAAESVLPAATEAAGSTLANVAATDVATTAASEAAATVATEATGAGALAGSSMAFIPVAMGVFSGLKLLDELFG